MRSRSSKAGVFDEIGLAPDDQGLRIGVAFARPDGDAGFHDPGGDIVELAAQRLQFRFMKRCTSAMVLP